MASPTGDAAQQHTAPPSPRQSPNRPRSKSYAGGTNKKTPSGSLFTKLPFFRSTLEASPTSPTPDDIVPFPDMFDHDDDQTELRSPSLVAVFDPQGKARNRKGSLRKTALLSTGRFLERRFSSDSTKLRGLAKRRGTDSWRSKADSSNQATPRASVDEDSLEVAKRSSDQSARQQHHQPVQAKAEPPPALSLLSPVTSPTGPYSSATDDEDRFTIPSTVGSLSIPVSKPSPSPSPPSSESSVSNLPSLQALRTSSKPALTSPLAAQSPDEINEDWDYAATEWWGWIILLVTWIVFVVGMGSCLEVWSWAWDVGETPYAPPELEDDPTLPIVGYYPALMVLTAVMSWVWVVVAWMGMKYFKHAKIQGDDT